MEYYKSLGGHYIKGNEQHVLIIESYGEIDNKSILDLNWYKKNWKLSPITREEFDKEYKKIIKDLNQFMAL